MTPLPSATIESSTSQATCIKLQPSLILESSLKRKANAEAIGSPHPPARRPKLSQETPLAPLRHTRFSTPETGSILAIVRENCRARLYLPPLHWTAEQVRLLGFRFVAREVPRRKRSDKRIPPELQPSGDGKDLSKFPVTPLDYAAHAAKSLFKPYSVEARTAAASDVLAACNFKYAGISSPIFYFDRDRYDTRLPALALFTAESGTPSLAYMNLDKLQPTRRTFLHREKSRCFYDSGKKRARFNSPVSRLIEKKLRQLQPENELEDPCVIAVLIALAQKQYWAQQQLSNSAVCRTPDTIGAHSHSDPAAGTIPASEQMMSHSKSFKVHVLATPCVAAKQLYLYTACIPASVLDKFDQPSRASPSAVVTVAYYALPLRRPYSLPRKLFLALHAPLE